MYCLHFLVTVPLSFSFKLYYQRVLSRQLFLMNILIFILCAVSSTFGWQYYTSFNDYTLIGTKRSRAHVHSDYRFGNCQSSTEPRVLYSHVHKDHIEILGKVIVRGWIEAIRIPTCIILRATSHEYDLMRSTTYNFQICVPRITYCHSQKRYKYFYYEWYIPEDMIGGMNWDLFFFGPASVEY